MFEDLYRFYAPCLRNATTKKTKCVWKGENCAYYAAYHNKAKHFGHWPDDVPTIVKRLCEGYRIDASDVYRVPLLELKQRYVALHGRGVALHVGRAVCQGCNTDDPSRVKEPQRLRGATL